MACYWPNPNRLIVVLKQHALFIEHNCPLFDMAFGRVPSVNDGGEFENALSSSETQLQHLKTEAKNKARGTDGNIVIRTA